MTEKTTEVKKTYKREVAGGMLAFLATMSVAGVVIPGALNVAETLVTPIFLFAGGAFGMDAYASQIKKPGEVA